MKLLPLLLILTGCLSACVGPVMGCSPPLYNVEEQSLSNYAEAQGWCDMTRPTVKGSVYYARENGKCVAKVK